MSRKGGNGLPVCSGKVGRAGRDGAEEVSAGGVIAGGLAEDEAGGEEFGQCNTTGAKGKAALTSEVLNGGNDEAALGEGLEEEEELAGVGGEGVELGEGKHGVSFRLGALGM